MKMYKYDEILIISEECLAFFVYKFFNVVYI